MIHELGEKLQAREADSAARLEVIEEQEKEIIRLQQQLNDFQHQFNDLQKQFLMRALRWLRLV